MLPEPFTWSKKMTLAAMWIGNRGDPRVADVGVYVEGAVRSARSVPPRRIRRRVRLNDMTPVRFTIDNQEIHQIETSTVSSTTPSARLAA